MTTSTNSEIAISALELADLPDYVDGLHAAFKIWDKLEPVESRPPPAVRARLAVERMVKLVRSDECVCVKATVGGKFAGVTVWQYSDPSKGVPVFNRTRRVAEDDPEMWVGIDGEKWENEWKSRDEARAKVMEGRPHWYLGPLYVLPEYQKRGIGRLLMNHMLDKLVATNSGDACFLEASPAGEILYRKLGFEVVGVSEGGENLMVWWGPSGKGK